MSEAKHTPGPWVTDGTCIYKLNDDGSNIFLAQVTGGYLSLPTHRQGYVLTSLDEVEAVARLMGSAPELLAALKALYEATPDNEGGNLGVACRIARAAIAKAEGRR